MSEAANPSGNSGLAADPSAHIDIAIGCAGTSGIHVKTDACFSFFAHPASATGDIERYRNDITDTEKLDIAAFFNNFPGDFMSQHQTGRSCGPAADHMLIAAADIRRNDSEDDSMLALAAAQL